MDPHVNEYNYTRNVTEATYEGLLLDRQLPDGGWEIGPNLAKSWEVSDDGIEYTFYLEEGVQFTDGTPFNAEAVKWNYERIAALAVQPAGKMYRAADLKVEVLDEYTAKIILPQAYAPFLATTRANPLFISPTAAEAHQVAGEFGEYGDYGQEWLYENAVGTGPYLLEEWNHGESVRLVKNPDYWRGWEGNHLESIALVWPGEAGTRKMMIMGGQCDLTVNLPFTDLPELEADPDVVVLRMEGTSVDQVQIRPRGPFADPRVMQAAAHAIDYDAIVDGVLLGRSTLASGPLAPTTMYFDTSLPPFRRDVEKAKELLTDAGYPDGLPGTYELWYLPNYKWYWQAEAELIQANLADVGINVVAQGVPEAGPYLAEAWSPDLENEPTMFFLGASSTTGDPDTVLRKFMHTDSSPPMGENVAFYSKPEVDRLLDEGITYTDPEDRRAVYAELQKIFVEDRPIVWLQFPDMYFFHSTTLQGYWVPPFKTAPFGSYYEMWLQGE